MHRCVWILGLAAALAATPAGAISFANVVSLGDSLFDDPGGNRSPLPPEHVAARLGAPLTQLAQGGATTSSLLSSGQHTTASASFGPGDLAMLWIGGNDFLANGSNIAAGNFAFLDTVEANVDIMLEELASAGMDVVVFNLPDFSVVPSVINSVPPSLYPNFRAASADWRTRLDGLADTHGAAVVDVFALLDDLVANPGDYAVFGNPVVFGPTTGCQFCLFYDTIHPSALAQGYATNAAIATMNAFYDPGGTMPILPLSDGEIALLAGVPEPGTAVPVALGVAALGARRRSSGLLRNAG